MTFDASQLEVGVVEHRVLAYLEGIQNGPAGEESRVEMSRFQPAVQCVHWDFLYP
mgnify:CR=1 FL=1